ncbi:MULTISPECIES: SemiSWEET family sugar transporter [Shimia]|uniref:SemiSWEET family sugar transporter n=1 Tax=Shimia TaxID=573139 RepID=UPI001FB345DE|nr:MULTISPECIES: SemiSWEET family transporter [Shimia]MDV4144901.1 SemiSWEET family transporter [Shimia sp. FJ5]
MSATLTPVIGYAAAVLGAISWAPQAVRVWRTGDTRDLSLLANGLFLVNVMLWLAYGLLLMDWPIILANTVGTLVMIAIVTAKLKYG